MKKHMYLGLDKDIRNCIVLVTPYSFSELEKDKEHITTSDFTSYYGTNWCGHDDLVRTCNILDISIKDDDVIYLDKPIVFTGVDDDMGHEYPWRFEVDSIVEVRAKEN